jgi:uncharacterized protein with NRDE domain
MCLIAFAINAQAGQPLWVAANRDEQWGRDTAPLHRWALDDGTEVVGGRDLRDGGTWLGISPSGRVAMLTNVRQATLPSARLSRGTLVTQALQSESAHGLMAGLDPEAYGGFNLVWGNLNTGHWHWMSNRNPQPPHAEQRPALHHHPLGDGLYGLSNASLDTPWPKTLALKAALKAAMQARHEHEQLAQLAPVLTRATPENEEALPITGVPIAMERALSSPFVHVPERGYGTRSTLWMRLRETPAGWQADLDEWTHDPGAPRPALRPEQHRRVQVTAA